MFAPMSNTTASGRTSRFIALKVSLPMPFLISVAAELLSQGYRHIAEAVRVAHNPGNSITGSAAYSVLLYKPYPLDNFDLRILGGPIQPCCS